jgi:hypothetical protein
MSDSPDPFDFDPVPSASRRRDGWTPERQRLFIFQLARIGIVSAAARAAGMSPKSAYALLKRAGEGSGFARAWGAARHEGGCKACDKAIERAIDGVAVPVFYRGRQIGEHRRYNDRLLIAALRHLHPQTDLGSDPWES